MPLIDPHTSISNFPNFIFKLSALVIPLPKSAENQLKQVKRCFNQLIMLLNCNIFCTHVCAVF